jgi:ribosomal protein S18 acetylase RimI-like enzyme
MNKEPYLVTTDEDKDIVTAMHRHCFADTEMPKLQVALGDNSYFIILGGDDGEGWPTGYVVCRIIDGKSILLWIGVGSEYRGRGWGRILTLAALDESRIRGAETIDLYVAEDNTPAIHLYKSLGFVNVDTHVGFYAYIQGGADDAYQMRASLMKNENQWSTDITGHPV